MTAERIVKVLAGLPPLRLTLLDLAQECCDEDGQLNQQKLRLKAMEIEEAIRQAKAYTNACARMRQEVARCAKSQ